jgi:nucleolar pre-ribosomal-associated protein 2
LLELEKGSIAPASQLNEAAQIIGVDLRAHNAGVHYAGESPKRQTATASAPKEEWVLRWLLKKLKATIGSLNYRLDSDSWLLLLLLFDRIPPKTIAAILNEQKFLAILEDTLVDLDKFSAESVKSGSKDRLQMASKSQKRGQKRKRVNVEAESSDSTITHEFTPSSWAATLLYVLAIIQKLGAFSNQSRGIDWTARSHLKLALRGEPRPAANILGRTFRIATLALPLLAGASELMTHQSLLSVLPSVFDIWELKSNSQNGSTQSQNDVSLYLCWKSYPY